ncbi:hypothetical protein J2T60_001205 [Natronospira proteinivora]|uniref:CHRD domain-containing protein n=1 Tax=Natronospira proteinivora TaxID=1807133 RepID=A0ABT1G8K2_9GAMM|nr:hypothetical protein [Natronospira proteinivora]MCP1727240.1 hypothetical protein [Natronospira proteinivora]
MMNSRTTITWITPVAMLFLFALPSMAEEKAGTMDFAIGAEVTVDGVGAMPLSVGLASDEEARMSIRDPINPSGQLRLHTTLVGIERDEDGVTLFTVDWELHRSTSDRDILLGAGTVSSAEGEPAHLRQDGAIDSELDPEGLDRGVFEILFLFERNSNPAETLEKISDASG